MLADYGLAAVYGNRLAARHQLPLIYSSANVEYRMYLELSQHDLRRLPLVPYVYWAERAACRRASLVVTVSERDAQAYTQWIPRDRIAAIPQGFDPEVIHPFYPTPPSSPPVVLFIGSFRDQNNWRAAKTIVEQIAPQVRQVLPEVTFQLIGAAPPTDLSAPNVEFLGFVDEIAPYMQRANLFIAPMPIAPGISTKVVLGLAFGKTVLTTPQVAGALPRSYQQVHTASVNEFGDRIVDLLQTHPAVDGREFEQLCQDFAWPQLMARLARRIEAQCGSPMSIAA